MSKLNGPTKHSQYRKCLHHLNQLNPSHPNFPQQFEQIVRSYCPQERPNFFNPFRPLSLFSELDTTPLSLFTDSNSEDMKRLSEQLPPQGSNSYSQYSLTSSFTNPSGTKSKTVMGITRGEGKNAKTLELVRDNTHPSKPPSIFEIPSSSTSTKHLK